MSLNNIVKISSNEGGPIKKTNPLLSFDIPSNNVFDLTKSYINLNMSVDTDLDDYVYIPQVFFTDTAGGNSNESAMTNVALVKNVDMSCRQGRICDVRRVDVLRQNLNEYTLTTAEKQSLDYQSLVNCYDNSQQLNSIFRDIKREGNVSSANRSANVKIRMDQLTNFGNVDRFDTGKFGQTRLNVELNLDLLGAGPYLDTESGGWTRQNRNGISPMAATAADGFITDTTLQTLYTSRAFKTLEESPYFVGQALNIEYLPVANTGHNTGPLLTITKETDGTNYIDAGVYDLVSAINGTGGKCTVTVDAGGLLDTITLNAADKGKNYLGGETLTISSSDPALPGSGGTCTCTITETPLTGVADIRYITNIQWQQNGNIPPPATGLNPEAAYHLQLTLDNPLTGEGVVVAPLQAGQSVGEFAITGNRIPNFTITCNYGEIVLEQVTDGQPTPDDITYTEYVSEEFTSSAIQNFQQQFTVEPECLNLYVMSPLSILSLQNGTDSWRMRLNNKDLTNRVVEYKSPLALDRLSMCFGTSNMPLVNTNELYQSVPIDQIGYSDIPTSYRAGNKLLIMCNPLPITQQNKQVQLNITNSGAGITKLILFKECVRKLSA
jgi:hypothetical protein